MLSNRLAKVLPSNKSKNNYQKPYSLMSIDNLFLNNKKHHGDRQLPST